MPAELAIVILAAGKGTRMKSQRAKVLHEAAGLPLVLHVLRAVRGLSKRGERSNAWVVIGHQAETVRSLVEPWGARTVLQRPQLGTGHAVAQALRALPRKVKRVLVLPGDAPFITAETLRALLGVHAETESAATILSADLDDPPATDASCAPARAKWRPSLSKARWGRSTGGCARSIPECTASSARRWPACSAVWAAATSTANTI
jgi:bifunctional N-acetylglucosamine-1-phosphate-uridyltransferase/glucosamine-1-phosphate-acetyltransferase GlmU-like protein